MSFVVWITGPSGAGKTTLVEALAKKLRKLNIAVEVLDGDGIRSKLYPDLGFSREEREMHNRVVVQMANLLAKNGIVTLVSIISPYRETRETARREIERFMEVYLKCPLEVRIERDPKGLYAKAIYGELEDLTGYNGVYEEPENPDLVLETDKMSVDEEVDAVIQKAIELGLLRLDD
jgi:adenylylsulfate kinase